MGSTLNNGRPGAAERIVRGALRQSIQVQTALLDQHVGLIVELADLLIDAFRAGNKIVLFGNGGSAADAQHVASELVNRLKVDRVALPAIALTTDTSLLTSISNDTDFDQIFARQVQALVQPGDVVAGISTSGNSPNVLAGLRAARAKGATTLGFTGQTGGQLAGLADVCFRAPSDDTPRIQEAHIVVWHTVCEIVEQAFVQSARWAVFLDRDGTINEEVDYLSHPEELRLIPGAAGAIRRLNQAGIPAIVVTNQSAVGRGYFPETRLAEIHRALSDQLAAHGAHLDAVYYCPHHPDENCDCRKPKPGLLIRAAQEHRIDLARSVMVGDKISDLDAGRRAGCRTALVRTGYGREAQEDFKTSDFQPDHVSETLHQAVAWILEQDGYPPTSGDAVTRQTQASR